MDDARGSLVFLVFSIPWVSTSALTLRVNRVAGMKNQQWLLPFFVAREADRRGMYFVCVQLRVVSVVVCLPVVSSPKSRLRRATSVASRC